LRDVTSFRRVRVGDALELGVVGDLRRLPLPDQVEPAGGDVSTHCGFSARFPALRVAGPALK
jgi:hypothetical protein